MTLMTLRILKRRKIQFSLPKSRKEINLQSSTVKNKTRKEKHLLAQLIFHQNEIVGKKPKSNLNEEKTL
jgi:hypothetical protein